MSHRKYLKQRGQSWYFQLAVPSDLQKAYGSKVIQTALGTTDINEARRLRWDHLSAAHEVFDRLRRGKGITSVEIEQSAQAKYRQILADAEDARSREKPIAWAPPEVSRDGEVAFDGDHELAGLDIVKDQCLDALRDDDFRTVEGEAEQIIKNGGVAVPKDSEVFKELCRSLLRARLEAYRSIMAHREGQRYQPHLPLNPAVIDPLTLEPKAPPKTLRPRQGHGVTISDAAEQYVAERMRDPTARWTQQTKGQNEASYRMFSEFLGDAPMATVTREDASSFVDTIAQLHRNYGRSRRAKGLSIWALLESCKGEPSLSNKTLDRHISALNGLFRWARKRGLYKGENPFAEQQRKTGRQSKVGYVPFTIEELNRLFKHPLLTTTSHDQRVRPSRHTTRTALMWIPLIGLFSGMRSGEICQLRVKNVQEGDGILFFDITEEDGTQSVKTEAGIRKVPVHSELIRCGFLEYLAAAKGHPSGQLFPGLKPGGPDKKLNWYFGRAFLAYRRDQGVDRDRLGFHSFRKNVGAALERARVPENEAVQVLGHEKLSMSYSVYSLGLDLEGLRDVLETVTYEGLDLGHLHVP